MHELVEQLTRAGAERWMFSVGDGALLGLFMVSACSACVLVLHPGSLISRRVRRPLARRAVIGALMGLTAVGLITSPLGRLTGAHMNPATTLAFWMLGKVQGADAVLYVLAQFVGGAAGVGAARVILGRAVAHPSVRFAVTQPGPRGPGTALIGEALIAFVLLSTVLLVSNEPGIMTWTPWVVAGLVWMFIVFEAPLSGMSMNPARTLASALGARSFNSLWVYLLGPVLGMGAAGVMHGVLPASPILCAKLDHTGEQACPFVCNFRSASGDSAGTRPGSGHPTPEPASGHARE